MLDPSVGTGSPFLQELYCCPVGPYCCPVGPLGQHWSWSKAVLLRTILVSWPQHSSCLGEYDWFPQQESWFPVTLVWTEWTAPDKKSQCVLMLLLFIAFTFGGGIWKTDFYFAHISKSIKYSCSMNSLKVHAVFSLYF